LLQKYSININLFLCYQVSPKKENNSVVQAVGVDIVDIDRFATAIHRWGRRFAQRVLTEKEIAYCDSKATAIHSMAVRFAAKEALLKCLPTKDQHGFQWNEMEVLNVENGKPVVYLNGRLARLLHNKNVHISLSHTKTSAVAVVILEQKGKA
jgi:holo-[acyl-carrier protein] synthase